MTDLKLFHTTPHPIRILRDGFRDATTEYEDGEITGVWLADRPVGVMEGARGQHVLVVTVPETLAIEHLVSETLMPGSPDEPTGPARWFFREFVFPSRVLNQFPRRRARAVDHPDLDSRVIAEPEGAT